MRKTKKCRRKISKFQTIEGKIEKKNYEILRKNDRTNRRKKTMKKL